MISLVLLWKLRRLPQTPVARRDWPPVLLLRPADAPSRAERAALATPIDYPGEIEQVILGRGSSCQTLNRKLGHLQQALATLPRDRAVVIADADVRVDGALIRALVAPDADLVFAAPEPEAGHSLDSWAARAALSHSLHNFRALFALRVGAPAICGKAMALGPRAQRDLLGLDDCIAEDLRLAERVHARGGLIVLAEVTAKTLPSAGLARFTRWFQALHAHRPWAFWSIPLVIAPLPLLLFAPPWAFVAAFALRAVVAHRLQPRGWQWFWLAEPLLLLAFIRALLRRDIRWQQRTLVVAAGGRIVEAR